MDSTTVMNHILPLVSNRELQLILLPTEQCNFRCTYCYEDFAIGRMKPGLISGIKKLLERRAPGLQRLAISWFGGEPLVAKDIVLDISQRAQQLSLEHGSDFISSITTNAYLLGPELFQRLLSCRVVDYQVSLDGLGEVHDQTRKRINGAGSFDQIWKNLLAMRSSGVEFSVLLRVHLQPHSAAGLGDLMTELIREFGADRRFDAAFKAVGSWGGANAGQFPVLSFQEGKAMAEALAAQWEQARPFSPKSESPGPYVCYAARPNAFVVRADGSLAKCTVKLSDPRNRIGSLSDEGTFTMDRSRHDLWLRGLRSLDENTLACPAWGLPSSETLNVLPG